MYLAFREDVAGIHNCEVELPSGDFMILTIISSLGEFSTYISGEATGNKFSSLDEAIRFLSNEVHHHRSKPTAKSHLNADEAKWNYKKAVSKKSKNPFIFTFIVFILFASVVAFFLGDTLSERTSNQISPQRAIDYNMSLNRNQRTDVNVKSEPEKSYDNDLDISIRVREKNTTKELMTLRDLIEE